MMAVRLGQQAVLQMRLSNEQGGKPFKRIRCVW